MGEEDTGQPISAEVMSFISRPWLASKASHPLTAERGEVDTHGTDGVKWVQTHNRGVHLNLPIAAVNLAPANGIPSRAGLRIHRLLSCCLRRATEIISPLKWVYGFSVPVRYHKHLPCEHLHSKAIARQVTSLMVIC